MEKNDSTTAVGRRKEALARVRLIAGNGQITVNDKPIGEYFKGIAQQKLYLRPLEISNVLNKYHISIKVKGGGTASQLDAVIHGLSRVLSKADINLRPALKKEGFLTRDARVKERRKYGNAQKARAKKQSPKR